jgi:hypothetical protein
VKHAGQNLLRCWLWGIHLSEATFV